MNHSPLYSHLLEAPLLIPNIIHGDKGCNYEEYLKEIINASEWFQQHYSGPFCAPKDESHGECDAYAGNYGLDFKLIASKTALQARSIHSLQMYKEEDGAFSGCGPKSSGSMMVTRFPQAFRRKTIDELLKIRKEATKKQGIENDIKEYLDTLETKKNLLLFYPYRFSFKQPGELVADIQSIVKVCQDDFEVTLNYRTRLYPSWDTFFVFLYDYYFVLCKWSGSSLVFLEAVPIERSDTFQDYAMAHCLEWTQKYDVVLRMIEEGKSEEEVTKEIDEEYQKIRNILPQ